ncbi:vascular endothelial growth factor Ab isoform X2 [Antennarius striatus]|uniref:vascular endothelial growth factor Ab isoform X2 n=1 Tax=Antennarius striatus TaxID=241820 RepID=UPI0035B093C1
MNIIDSLTLLFLTLSVVKSAHIPKETERSPHEVIPLLEVFNKSLCKPREMLVEILQEYPEEVEHIFIPSCVVLTRCAGCCNDEMLECVPTSTYNVTMEIKRVKTRIHGGDVYMSFTEHSACECRKKKDVKEQKEKKSRKGNAKGQKRKRKKNRDKTIHDAFYCPVHNAGTLCNVKIQVMDIYFLVFVLFCFLVGGKSCFVSFFAFFCL